MEDNNSFDNNQSNDPYKQQPEPQQPQPNQYQGQPEQTQWSQPEQPQPQQQWQQPEQPQYTGISLMRPDMDKEQSDKVVKVAAIVGMALALIILLFTVINNGSLFNLSKEDQKEKTSQGGAGNVENLTKEEAIAWLKSTANPENNIVYPDGLLPKGISGKLLLLSSYDSVENLDDVIKNSYIFYDSDSNSPVSDLKINKNNDHFVTFSSDSYNKNSAIGRVMLGISFDRQYFDFSYEGLSADATPIINTDNQEFIKTVLATLLLSSFSQIHQVYSYKYETSGNISRLTIYCIGFQVGTSGESDKIILYNEHVAFNNDTKEIIIDDYYDHSNDLHKSFDLSSEEGEELERIVREPYFNDPYYYN